MSGYHVVLRTSGDKVVLLYRGSPLAQDAEIALNTALTDRAQLKVVIDL